MSSMHVDTIASCQQLRGRVASLISMYKALSAWASNDTRTHKVAPSSSSRKHLDASARGVWDRLGLRLADRVGAGSLPLRLHAGRVCYEGCACLRIDGFWGGGGASLRVRSSLGATHEESACTSSGIIEFPLDIGVFIVHRCIVACRLRRVRHARCFRVAGRRRCPQI